MSEWLPIASHPKNDGYAFLVLLPGNDVCDSLVLQVSNFEGQTYPDCKDGIIDWEDRITEATHWMPLPPPPTDPTP